MRNRLLAAVQHSLYMEAQAFLKKHLSKSPMSSLDECLRSTFRGLPIDVTQELGNTELVQSVQADPRKPDGVPGALRLVRNDLSHGTRSYDVMQVHEVATILNRAARAHLLRLLGCDEKIQTAALAPRS